MLGGSTLGNILTGQVSIKAADIGLPQLSMHSTYETAGCKDLDDMITLMGSFMSLERKCRFNGRKTFADVRELFLNSNSCNRRRLS